MVSSHFTTDSRVDSNCERREENNLLSVDESSIASTSTVNNIITRTSNIPITSANTITNDANVNNSPSIPTKPTASANGNSKISTGCRSQSGPPSLSIGFDDVELKNSSIKNYPVNFTGASAGLSNLVKKFPVEYGEESYEGIGYGRGVDELVDVEVESPGDGSSSAPSPTPTGLNSLGRNTTASPSSTLGRHTWLRTSLRRTPPGARPTRQLGSNALASQLYRSGSFNSSGRGSTCDATDDMYSDVSLEDDVIDLNHRVRMIQEQMDVLVDTQSLGGERYARVKQENATLQARILMLEEAAKDTETRAEEKLQAEQRRHKELITRLDREKQLELENYAIKLQSIEHECSGLKEQVIRFRQQLEAAKEDRNRLENTLDEAKAATNSAREAERQAIIRENETRILLDSAKEELAARARDRLRIEDLLLEVAQLGAKNKSLQESQDELQAAVALHAGRELLMLNPPNGYGFEKNPRSLAAELSVDCNNDQLDGRGRAEASTDQKPRTMAEALQALREQQEVNAQLHAYIDGILLNIVENYPQLLEVKQPH
ncbi:hypothetical protein PV326_002670 [Microctonus aethiopoides]|nr:hypothetical protein PV326_002670 [Microctonus aethiopoides]